MSENEAGFPSRVDDIPPKYRRCYNNSKKGKKAGSILLRKCKCCIFWKDPMPGRKEGCHAAWQLDPKRGPCPDDFRCGKFLHKEHRKSIKELSELSLGVLRAVVVLSKIAKKLGSVSTKEDIIEAIRIIITDNAKLGVIADWGKPILKSREAGTSFDIPSRSEWQILDEATGERFTGIVWTATKAWVEFFPDKQFRKKYGENVKYPPDRFVKIAQRIEEEEEPDTEDED